jgi:hypothetical protein
MPNTECDRMGRLAGLIKGKLRAKYMRARDKLYLGAFTIPTECALQWEPRLMFNDIGNVT